MMLILPIHEHSMCFHLFVSSSISFSVSYNFPSMGLLYPWLGLFLGILFFLKQFKWDFFLIFRFVSLLLAYKHATECWILICALVLCRIH